MGLFDTVDSLGIPRLNTGVGFDWPEFYDQKISSEVEKVYHAISLHDRLWMFEPCLALRDPETAAENPASRYTRSGSPDATTTSAARRSASCAKRRRTPSRRCLVRCRISSRIRFT